MTNNELREIIDKHSANNAQSDLISRADAIEAFENKVSIEGEDNAYKFGLYVQGVMDKIKALPSAELPNGELISRADAIEAIRTTKIVFDSPIDGFVKHDITDLVATVLTEAFEALPSADAENSLYIKIYADDEPSVKAEKLYQICGETQNREVAKWLKEYFSSAEEDREDYELATEQMEHDAMYEPTYNSEDGSM